MVKRIYNFTHFVNEMRVSEASGYGEEPYFFAKDGDLCNYLFKVDAGNSRRGFIIGIGKFSQFTQPTEAKTDYGVISITEVAEDVLDQAVTDKGKFEQNNKHIDVDSTVMSQIMGTLDKIIDDYLQNNPKVNKFYDEMQAKVKSDLYDAGIKDSVAGWPGEWSFQEIEKGKLNLISK